MICIPNTPEIDELRKQYNRKYKDHMTEHQFIALLEAMMSRYSAKSIPDNLSAINKYYKEQKQKDAEMERLISQPKFFERGFKPSDTKTSQTFNSVKDNNNGIIDVIDNAVKTGNWSDEALDAVETLTEYIENGSQVFKRFSQAESGSVNGILGQAEALISRGDGRSDIKDTGNKVTDALNRFQQGQQQEVIIEQWAKEAGLWFNDYTDRKGKSFNSLEKALEADYRLTDKGQTESVIYEDERNNNYIKAISLSHSDDNPQMLLDRIVLHNTYSPATALEVIGFGRDSLGHFRVVVKQKFVEGTMPSFDEIDSYAEQLGLQKIGGFWYSPDKHFRVTDITEYNVIKEAQTGQLAIIDADFELIDKTQGLVDVATGNELFSLVPEEARQIASTIAPYRETTYADYVHMSPEERNKMRNAFAAAAKNTADLLGIELDMSVASANIGGYQFENGGEIVEPSFTFRMNTTPEKARMFSALMADLGWEQQESVATFMNVDNPADGNGVRFTIKFSERLLPLLEKHGIKNFTFDKQNEVLSVLSFDEADVQKLYNLTEELNNGQPENRKQEVGTAPFFSTLDFEEDRRALYEEWLRREGGQDPVLDNLVKTALQKVTPQQQQQQTVATGNNQTPAPVNTNTQAQQPVQDTTSIDEELESVMKAQASAMSRESNNEMLKLTQELADKYSQEEIRTMVDYIASAVMRQMDIAARNARNALLDELADPNKSEDEKARIKAQIAKLSDRADKYAEMFRHGTTPLDIISEVINELGAAMNGDSFYASTIGDANAHISAATMVAYFDPLLRSAFLVIHRKTGIEFSIDVENMEGDDIIDAVENAIAERQKQEAEQNAAPTQEMLEQLAQKYKGTIAEVPVVEEPKTEDDNPEEANKSDAPFFDVRKENPYKSLAPAIRMLLSNVSANEQDGFKQQRMLDPEFVYAALMDLLSKEVNNPEDFYTMEEIQEGDPDYKRRHMFPDGKKPVFHALEKYRYKYRWMPALIKTLTDDFVCNRDMNGVNAKLKAAGMEPMETQFGRTVTMLFNSRKEFVPFTTLTEDGTLVQVNELTSDESIEKVVLANYNSRTMLTRTMIYDKEGKVNFENVKILLDGLKPVSGRLGSDDANNQFLEVIYAVNRITAKEYGDLLDDISHYWALDNAAKAAVDAKEKAFNERRIELAKQMLEERFGEWGNDNRVEVFKTLIDYTNTLRSLGFDVREEDVFQGTNEKKSSRVIDNGIYSVKNILTRISSDEFLNSGVDNIYAGTDQALWTAWKTLYEQMDDVVYASQHSTSTREHGKERYSFMPANEITRQWKELTHMDINRRRAYIAEKWGSNPFFRDQTKPLTNPDSSWNTGDVGWRNMYLELQWDDNPRLRLTEEMKADIIANKGKEFEDWNGTDIAEMQLALYAKGITSATGERNNALYMLPIFADSPVCKALGGRRYSVNEVVDKMTEVAMQEVDRIQGVARELALREYAKEFLKAEKAGKTLDFESLSPSLQDIALEFNPNAEGISQQQKEERRRSLQAAANHNPAANFADGKINNGLKFQFIPELNDYVVSQAGGQNITVLDIIQNNTKVSRMDKMTPAEIRTMLQEAVDKVLARKYNDYFARFHTVYSEQIQRNVNQSAILHAFKQREFYTANPGMGGNEYIRRGANNSVWIYVEDGQPFWRVNQNNNGGRMVVSRGEWFYLSGSDDAYLQRLSHDELDIAKEEERLADTRVPIKEGNFGVIAAHNAKGWGVDRLMRDMWYNSTFANSQIIQLMFGDIAYAKNFDDFQKRWKALYAGGMQLDYNCIGGRREYNMVILKDNKRAISSSYGNIYKAFDNAVKEGRITEAQRDQWCASYHQIDATDAQGLRSLDSFRRLLKMAGKWTAEAEQSYQRITHDKWTSQDLEFMVQTIKPVYMGSNQQTLPGGMVTQVPMYIKNSEAVLLTLFKAIQIPYSPTLKALDRVQKAITYKDGPNAGQTYIDAFQYETAVKLGGQGAVDLRYSRVRLGALKTRDGWPDMQARDSFWQWRRNQKDFKGNPNDFSTISYDEISQWAEESLSKAKGNDEVGKALKMVNGVLNFLDYSRKEDANLQQRWENEMVDILNGAIYSDPNSDEINPEVVHQLDNNCLVIQQPTPHHPVTGKVSFGSQLRYLMPIDLPDDIEVTIMRKLSDGREVPQTYKKKELIEHYNRLIVARALKGYEEANSVFADIHALQKYLINIVKDNPRYGDDMLNALEIVEWTDEQGQKHETFALPNTSVNMANKLEELFTAVYRNKVHKQKMHGGSTILMADMKYSDELEVRFKDGHLEGVECWLPASAKDILESCGKMNDKGEYVIDPKDLQREGMDKIVGYRIPTDDKHSMLPLIVKGFLPPAMGSALVVSKEIIIMTGGDNDVDKLYLFTHHYTMNKRGKMVKVQYDSGHIENGEWVGNLENNNTLAQIENEIIDVCYKILTNDKVSDKLFKPQDYEGVRDTAMMIQIINDRRANAFVREEYAKKYGKDAKVDFMNLDRGIMKEAYKLTDRARSPIYPETYAYYHNQNSSGKAEVGIFANNSALNAKLQDKGIMVKDKYVINVNDREIREVSPMFIYAEGKKMRVSDNCSELLGAAADTAKDPLLARMGITKNNAAFAGFMVRMGLTLKETGMLISIYKKHGFPEGFGKTVAKLRESGVNPIIDTRMLEKVLSTDPDRLNTGDEDVLNVLYALYNLKDLAYNLRQATIGMQADSPNHALETDFASALYYKYATIQANRLINDPEFPFDFPKKADGTFENIIPINGDDSFEKIMSSKAPVTQAYHTLGISKALENISKRSIASDPAFDDWMMRLSPYLFTGKKDDAIKIIRALYREYITFYLSRLPMFNEGKYGGFIGNRQWFKYQFPLAFQKWVGDSGIKNNIALSRIQVDIDNRLTIDQESVSEMTVPYIFAGLDALWQETGNGFADDTTERCARALLKYCYFANGLTFSFGDIANFFSVSYLSREGHFDEYIEALAELEQKCMEAQKTGNSQLTPVESDRYFTQFMRNNASRFELGRVIVNDSVSGIPYKDLAARIDKSLKTEGKAICHLTADEERRFTDGLFYRVPVQDPNSNVDPIIAALGGATTFSKYDIYECRLDGDKKVLVKISDGLENDKWYYHNLSVDDMNRKEEWYHPGVKADTWYRPITTRQLRKAAAAQQRAEQNQQRQEELNRDAARPDANDTTSQGAGVPDMIPPESGDVSDIDFSHMDDDMYTDDGQLTILSGMSGVFDAMEEMEAESIRNAQRIEGINVEGAIESGGSKMENPNDC